MNELELDNAAGPVVTFTTRVPCRSCGRSYALPRGVGSPPAGMGPCCQPMLFAAVPYLLAPPAVELAEGVELEERPARDLGWFGLDDVLCEACRLRLAQGRLTPGVALCLECAEETVEHWLAGLVDPYHSWDPTDNPFGSARYPVREWRMMEVES